MGSSNNVGEAEREKEIWEDEEAADGFGKTEEGEESDQEGEEWEGKGSGSWVPGQGVVVPYAEIVEILLRHVSYPSKSRTRRTVSSQRLLIISLFSCSFPPQTSTSNQPLSTGSRSSSSSLRT